MPECIDEDGVGYYGEEASTVYKDLAALGVDAKYYTTEHESIHRFSAKEEVIKFALAFFIEEVPKAVMYDLLKTYVLSKFKKRPRSVVEGKVMIASELNGFSTWQEFKITGDVDDAIKMIDKIQELHTNESRAGTKGAK